MFKKKIGNTFFIEFHKVIYSANLIKNQVILQFDKNEAIKDIIRFAARLPKCWTTANKSITAHHPDKHKTGHIFYDRTLQGIF